MTLDPAVAPVSVQVGEAALPLPQTELGKRNMRFGKWLDLTSDARKIGFVVPVVLSRNVWEELIEIPGSLPSNRRKKERRILDILLSARAAAVRAGPLNQAQFHHYRLTEFSEQRSTGKAVVCRCVVARCIPGDDETPMVAISLATEF